MEAERETFYQQFISYVNNIEDRKLIKGYYDAIKDGMPGFESRLRSAAGKYLTELQVKLLLDEPARFYNIRKFDLMLTSLFHGMGYYSKEEALKFAKENKFSTIEIERACAKGDFIKDYHREKTQAKLRTGLPKPMVVNIGSSKVVSLNNSNI